MTGIAVIFWMLVACAGVTALGVAMLEDYEPDAAEW